MEADGMQASSVVFAFLMMTAAAYDVLRMRIPNVLTLTIAAAFFPLAVATGLPIHLLPGHLATFAVLLLAGFGLFHLGFIGGGDAKLIAVAGLWLGFPCVLPFLLFTALVGGLLGVAVGVVFMAQSELRAHSEGLGKAFSQLAPDVPYGFAIAIGAMLAIPFSRWSLQVAGSA